MLNRLNSHSNFGKRIFFLSLLQLHVTQCLRLCFPETGSKMKVPVRGVKEFTKEVATGRIRVCAEKPDRSRRSLVRRSLVRQGPTEGRFNLILAFSLGIPQGTSWGVNFQECLGLWIGAKQA